MKVLISSSMKNLNRLESVVLSQNARGILLVTDNNRLKVVSRVGGRAYTLAWNVKDGFQLSRPAKYQYQRWLASMANYFTKALLHVEVALFIFLYVLVYKKRPQVFVDADTRAVPMIFFKLIGSDHIVHVQCQNCLPTFEMQTLQKMRNKSQVAKVPKVFGYGPAGKMLHLPTFIPKEDIPNPEKYEVYHPTWFYEHVDKNGIENKCIYKSFRRILWLDNDSQKVFKTKELEARQKKKIAFFETFFSANNDAHIVFRPHPVWSQDSDLRLLKEYAGMEERFSMHLGTNKIEDILSQYDVVFLTYSTAVFEVLAAHVAIVFVSINNDILADVWSKEFNLPIVHLPFSESDTSIFTTRKLKQYDSSYKAQFKRFFANGEDD
jgi:hypothetical protein